MLIGFAVNPSTPSYDTQMTHLLPGDDRASLSMNDPMCASAQEKGNQTQGYPMLTASWGDTVALRYRENGHITKATGDKATFGTVSVYGTLDARADDELVSIHHVWNANNTGGDQRGRLLHRQSFDDGACYEYNDTPLATARAAIGQPPHDEVDGESLACKVEIVLPTDSRQGQFYTLYWVWDWPSVGVSSVAPGTTKQQYYTTCIDIQIA